MLNIQEKACKLRSKGCTNKEGYLMKKASIRKSALKIVAVATAAFFRSKPMLDPADSPRISLITADYENGGESYRSTMEQTDISQN